MCNTLIGPFNLIRISASMIINFEIYALCYGVNIPNLFDFQALNLKNQSEATEDGDYNAETWTLEELFVRRPDLDAVVDLTSTKRYYDPRDMERAAPKGDDFAYFKIFTQGHEVPNRDVVGR